MKRVAGIVSEYRPLWAAILRRDEELYPKGWQVNSRIDFDRIQRFLLIEDAGTVVSFLAYEQFSSTKHIVIIGAWTDPAYRRQGLYLSLFNELVAVYRKKRYNKILSGFHKDNEPSRLMQEKRGSKLIVRENETFHSSVFYFDEELYA